MVENKRFTVPLLWLLYIAFIKLRIHMNKIYKKPIYYKVVFVYRKLLNKLIHNFKRRFYRSFLG